LADTIANIYPLSAYAALLEQDGLLTESHLSAAVADTPVNLLTADSREVDAGTLFVCKGAHFNDSYLASAVASGAVAYVSETAREAGGDLPYFLVNDMRRALAVLANFHYGQVWEQLQTIGITGTKGKSTTSYYTKAILDAWCAATGIPESAILSGIDNYDGVIREESHLTTPETIELHRHFTNAVRSGIRYLTMEVSSQALKYRRTDGVIFSVGCFLNIGTDHISAIEHSSFEDYFDSKKRIFGQSKVGVVNLDTPESPEILQSAQQALADPSSPMKQILTFGLTETADYRAIDIGSDHHGTWFSVIENDASPVPIKLQMTGRFNVANALAAIAATRSVGVDWSAIQEGLSHALVPGRMELFHTTGSPLVIVDYAHNQLSFGKLFETIKAEYPGKEIGIVFGCPGGKAFARRKELGELAGEYADRIYLTEEDPGEEPVSQISAEIADFTKPFGKKVYEIDDRELAIKQAIADSDENSVLLITGKGRETRQKRGLAYIDTPSDVAIVQTTLGLE
jgi:UDP-N-acetylmuramoyl-L-alanyl-D-glutamate--2,6-diaminopimelate ligase